MTDRRRPVLASREGAAELDGQGHLRSQAVRTSPGRTGSGLTCGRRGLTIHERRILTFSKKGR